MVVLEMVCKQEQLQAWCNFAVTAEPKSIEPEENFSDVEARIRHEKRFDGMSGAGKVADSRIVY